MRTQNTIRIRHPSAWLSPEQSNDRSMIKPPTELGCGEILTTKVEENVFGVFISIESSYY